MYDDARHENTCTLHEYPLPTDEATVNIACVVAYGIVTLVVILIGFLSAPREPLQFKIQCITIGFDRTATWTGRPISPIQIQKLSLQLDRCFLFFYFFLLPFNTVLRESNFNITRRLRTVLIFQVITINFPFRLLFSP